MAVTPSTMMPLGTKAPDFTLPDTRENRISLQDYSNAPALLVIFLSNHCPYVKHIRTVLSAITKEFIQKDVAVVGINANDVDNYPDDSPEKMVEEVALTGYEFPYLYDASQETAKVYQAACTPDFFLFDKNQQLVYRGQMDESRPGNSTPVTGETLKKAVQYVLDGKEIDFPQKPSTGCNIKWKAGNEPEYFSK